MASALDVAQYFLATQTPENDITNLKLQKLCAYAQALSLSLLDAPLFEEELEAWTHGPVIPQLYYAYERYGRRPIPSTGLSEHYARMPFTDEQKYVLATVGSYYGQYSAWTLRERSHRDFPGDFGSKMTISKEDIRNRFARDSVVVAIKKAFTLDMGSNELSTEREVMDALAV